MKTILYTWFAVLLFGMAAVSCGDDDTKNNDTTGITGSSWKASETVGADRTTKKYTFKASANWVAQSDKPEWCKILTSSGDKGSDRQHAQREHHRTGERLREGGTVRHHPARKQQRRHGRRHRAQQTGRQDPGVLLPVERRIPANVARPLAGLHQFQRQFPETHAAGDDDQRPRQKTAEQRQLLGLLLPAADAPHKGRRRDEARGQPRGRKEEGVRLRHRGPDGREVCGRQQPTYGRIRAGRHVGLPGLPGIGSRVPAGHVLRPVQRRGHHCRKPEFGLWHVNSPGRRKHGQAHRKQAGRAARIAHSTRNIPQSGNPQRSNHLRCA